MARPVIRYVNHPPSPQGGYGAGHSSEPNQCGNSEREPEVIRRHGSTNPFRSPRASTAMPGGARWVASAYSSVHDTSLTSVI